MLVKKISHAFNKDIYLLGKDQEGQLYWLESPSWDCGWYWGFGYIETYTNNRRPDLARDINSHSHFEGFLWGNDKTSEFKDGKWVENHLDYHHHINQSSLLAETVLTDNESWELSDLMKRFYTLKEAAEIFHTGSAHLTSSNSCDSTNKHIENQINKIELPKIFKRVLEILTPADK